MFIIFSGLGFFALSGGGSFGSFILWVLLFGTPGVILICIGYHIQRKSKRIKRYIRIVVDEQEHVLERIMAATKLPYKTVRRDLEEMIDKGYLVGVSINDTGREIVFK